MDKTDYKQLIIEIKNVGKRKEFKGFSKGIKNIEDVKDAYDYIIINICKKYNLDTNIVVDSMINIWSNAEKRNFEKDAVQLLPHLGLGGMAAKEIITKLDFTLLPTTISLISVGDIPIYKSLAMNKYMIDMQECIEEIAKKELEKNG